jgi:hypothetical protein
VKLRGTHSFGSLLPRYEGKRKTTIQKRVSDVNVTIEVNVKQN